MYEDIWKDYSGEIIGGATLVLIFVFIIPIFGQVSGLWSGVVSQLIIAGIGAVGTLTLAAVTAVTLWQNQQMVKEQQRQRERPLIESILRNIVWDALDKIESNKKKIRDSEFDWIDADHTKLDSDELEMVNLDLDLIGVRRDDVQSEQFVDRYPEAVEKMEQYDKYVITLDKYAYSVISTVREPLYEYLENNSERGEFEFLNNVVVFNAILGTGVDSSEVNPEWWEEHEEDIIRIVYENARDDYQDFLECQKSIQLLKYCKKLSY